MFETLQHKVTADIHYYEERREEQQLMGLRYPSLVQGPYTFEAEMEPQIDKMQYAWAVTQDLKVSVGNSANVNKDKFKCRNTNKASKSQSCSAVILYACVRNPHYVNRHRSQKMVS